MTAQTQECVEWFREHPAFQRLLKEMQKKYKRQGRAAGKVVLSDATEAECEAAKSLFGREFRLPLQFRIADFEAELQNSRFGCVSLKEVLEQYFQEEIRTARELREEQARRYADVLAAARAVAQTAFCSQWLAMLAERQAGADTLKRAVSQNEAEARRALFRACQCVDMLARQAGTHLRLAVLSALAVGDPHALDGGTLCGRLFLHALAFRSGRPFPAGAEERDSLCFQNGILCDSISSCVAQVGLLLRTETGEHPAYRVFRQRRELCTLTLSGVSRLTAAQSPSGKVYLVENEGVFCQLCDQAARFHSPLICTSGQPSVAALQLLALLAASGAELLYSGDFDGKGLAIALFLAARWPKHVRLWHFSPADYTRCRSEETLGDVSRGLLESCAGTILEETAQAVGACGLAGYQELLLPLLEADLTETP